MRCRRGVSVPAAPLLVNRYYDPNTDQFTSFDPLVSETGQPFSYADDDPVNGSDPSGLDCGGFGGFLASLSPVSHCNPTYQAAYNDPIGACDSNTLIFGTGGSGVCSTIPGTQQYEEANSGFNDNSDSACLAPAGVGAGLDPRAPTPPGYDPDTWSIGPPSKKGNPYESYYDPEGGEWRWHPPDAYHNGHWDYKPDEPWNAPWQRIPGPDGSPPLIEPGFGGGAPIDP